MLPAFKKYACAVLMLLGISSCALWNKKTDAKEDPGLELRYSLYKANAMLTTIDDTLWKHVVQNACQNVFTLSAAFNKQVVQDLSGKVSDNGIFSSARYQKPIVKNNRYVWTSAVHNPVINQYKRLTTLSYLSGMLMPNSCEWDMEIKPIRFSSTTQHILDSINAVFNSAPTLTPQTSYSSIESYNHSKKYGNNWSYHFFEARIKPLPDYRGDTTVMPGTSCTCPDDKTYRALIAGNIHDIVLVSQPIIATSVTHDLYSNATMSLKPLLFLSGDLLSCQTDVFHLYTRFFIGNTFTTKVDRSLLEAFFEIILYADHRAEHVKLIKQKKDRITLSFYSRKRNKDYLLHSYVSNPSIYTIVEK
jgi:hypothetical protein